MRKRRVYYNFIIEKYREQLTYLPHKAVAEVSKDKEPIGRGCVEFNWFESQLMSDSNELRVKWFGCHLIWDSIDLVVIWFEIQMILVVNWFGIQVIWMSNGLRFKWFGCHLIWDSSDFGCQLIRNSSDLDVEWFELEVIWLSKDLRFKWFGCQLIWDSRDLDVKWFEMSKMKLWSSKTIFFYETSFKNEALKLKTESFLRDFLQKWQVDQTLDLRIPIRFKWMLQKYFACHEKVEPRHTNSCHAKWSLQSNTSVTWNLQPFHGFCVGGFKHRHHKTRNPCACHAKSIVSEPLQIHVSKSLRLPHKTRFQPQKTSRDRQFLMILTSESIARAGVEQILRSSTSKSAPNMQRGAFLS